VHVSTLQVTVTEAEASAKVAASARATVGALFANEVAFVWRSMRRFGVAEADLEDQAQEVFIVAHKRLDSWDGRHPRAWLYEIARRCAAAYHRTGHRRHERVVQDLPEGSDRHDPSAGAELDLLSRIIATLDEDKRTVFILHEVEEMPMREVALAVECPLKTAYTRLYAARRELSLALEEKKK